MCIYIYIYIYMYICVYMCVYIYIYIYKSVSEIRSSSSMFKVYIVRDYMIEKNKFREEAGNVSA